MKNRAGLFVGIGSVLSIGLIATLMASASAKPAGIKDHGTSYVSIVHQKGKILYAAGYVFDKHFGRVANTYVTTVTPGTTGTVIVTVIPVTLYTAKGSLFGTGKAVQNLATGAVTNGKLNLTHGTGGLKGHSFRGTVAGAFDSTTGVYTFMYSGIYK
jgi:hypothetical protein